jgi:hypothetical protein
MMSHHVTGGGLKTVKVDGGSLAYITGRSGARVDAISLVFQVESKDRDVYTATEGFGGGGGGAFSDLPQLPAQIVSEWFLLLLYPRNS